MPGTHQQPQSADPRPTGRQPHRRLHRGLFIATSIAAAVLVLVGAATVGMNWLTGNVERRITVLPQVSLAPAPALPSTMLGAATYDAPTEPLNILFLGSDTRAGQGPGFGSASGYNGDTTMLMHVNAAHTKATIVSFPRDLWVTIPECTDTDGQVRSSFEGKFNSALPRGGPDCVIKTVTSLTGVPVHHVAVIDFTGFADMVDAVGGLRICLSEPVDDRWAKAVLPAGEQTINGAQALSLARARKTLADGSDIARIDRQQALLMHLFEQVTDRGLMADPAGMYRLAVAAAENLSLDEDLSTVPALAALAKDLSGIGPEDIRFVTVPWLERGDGENVIVNEQKAAALFASLRQEAPSSSPTASPTATPTGSSPRPQPTASTAEPQGEGICADPLW